MIVPSRAKSVAFSILLLATSATLLLAAAKKKSQHGQMDDSKRALHGLNRLTFGPRPGDVAKVNAMGVEKWIELQLNPQKIDDGAVEARLEPFRTLRMDTQTIVKDFPPEPIIKAVAEGKMRMPSEPKERAIYETQIEAYNARKERKAEGGKNTDAKPDDSDAQLDSMLNDMEKQQRRREARQHLASLVAMPANQRFDALLKMPADERRMLANGLPPEQREQLQDGFTAEQREQLQAMARPQSVITGELVQGKLLRAIYSERQLEEVMDDFWFNHFNVFIQKGADRYMTTAYERDAIRKHAMGKFKDLLLATAESPAMMFYLDNFQSVGPNSDAGQNGGRGRRAGNNARFDRGSGRGFGNNGNFRRQRDPFDEQMPQQRPRNSQNSADGIPPQPKPKRGLNENYARELMELHTLGVDGGYTQKDIIEVAKVFSGWTVKEPRRGGDFEFNERLHEPGYKVVLGRKIKSGGMNEGKKVLEMLARHPSTARFISRKLAMRFVSDDPPPALVDRMSSTYLKTDGDIKEVLRTLFKSPEFWAPEAYRAKVKTPLEFVVSAMRVTGADVKDAIPLGQALQKLGMPLYGMQPPTGYSMKAETWVNSAALLNRMNFALSLSSGKMRGISLDQQSAWKGEIMPDDSDGAIAVLVNALLAGDVSHTTRDTIRKQLDDPAVNGGKTAEPNLSTIAGLLLGSPEFQRR